MRTFLPNIFNLLTVPTATVTPSTSVKLVPDQPYLYSCPFDMESVAWEPNNEEGLGRVITKALCSLASAQQGFRIENFVVLLRIEIGLRHISSAPSRPTSYEDLLVFFLVPSWPRSDNKRLATAESYFRRCYFLAS